MTPFANLDPTTWTWGLELEWSDIPRAPLNPQMGTWDSGERDIVNTKGQYRGVAADPLGLEPPVGGEINTVPTRGWRGQLAIMSMLATNFALAGFPPVSGPTAHHHIHCCVPGLTQDIAALKRLACYVFDNQADFVEICGRYKWHHDMDRAAQAYFRMDGGRKLPAYILNNILDKATTFEEFIRMHAAGKDGIRMGRPFRYAINMYCLKHTGTIEFRPFRGTTDLKYAQNAFMACEMFLKLGLSHDKKPRRFRDWHEEYGPVFAPMQWDKELWDGLQKTKHDEKRGKKVRVRKEVP